MLKIRENHLHKNFPCSKCEKSFSTKQSLSKHLSSNHPSSPSKPENGSDEVIQQSLNAVFKLNDETLNWEIIKTKELKSHWDNPG